MSLCISLMRSSWLLSPSANPIAVAQVTLASRIGNELFEDFGDVGMGVSPAGQELFIFLEIGRDVLEEFIEVSLLACGAEVARAVAEAVSRIARNSDQD